MSDSLRLGYIGLGNMGAPMATKMTEWPGGVTVYDIRTEAMTPLAEKGAGLADSVADRIVRTARTGRIGDGKILVLPMAWPEPLEF